jgi:putative ubiquitin-RnfH superfamily antitoxin RatB of RatAB toxin-antitoxin module
MPTDALIRVEVCYARADVQAMVELKLPIGTSAARALHRSGLPQRFPEIDPLSSPLGVFGKKVDADTPLKDGDRLEIYRPLTGDPKEIRRNLAAQGKTMGKKPG